MEFNYIGDQSFRIILKRDFVEVRKCIEASANKAAIILSGSILESVLCDFFCENLPDSKTKSDILKLSLNALLELSVQHSVISSVDNSLATVLKTYRNLIHPGREIRSSEMVDNIAAKLAFSILEALLSKIEKKYREQFVHTAEEILDKLDEDRNFMSIYGLVITRLNSHEKNKLFDELFEIEVELKEEFEYFGDHNPHGTNRVYYNIENVKDLSLELIPLLSHELLMTKLEKLRDDVTKGECIESVAAYNLLHEQLGNLNNADQELIAIYMLSTFGSISENSRELLHDKTYSTIGKYIHTHKGFKAIKEFFNQCACTFGGSNIDIDVGVMEQIINSFPDQNKSKVLDYLNEIILPYISNLPLSIEEFARELVKRGIITLRT